MYDDTRIAAVESGPGPKRATRATQSLLDAHEPQWVLSVGFSGGLTPEIRAAVTSSSPTPSPTARTPSTSTSACPRILPRGSTSSGFLQVNEVVRTIAEKQALAQRIGAIAVDMESFAVAKVCVERRIRFLAIRCISDDLSEDLPPEILTIFGKSGFLRAGGGPRLPLEAAWSSYKDLLRLRDQAQDAARRLGALPPVDRRAARGRPP